MAKLDDLLRPLSCRFYPRRRVRGPGLQDVVGRVASRGGTRAHSVRFLALCIKGAIQPRTERTEKKSNPVEQWSQRGRAARFLTV